MNLNKKEIRLLIILALLLICTGYYYLSYLPQEQRLNEAVKLKQDVTQQMQVLEDKLALKNNYEESLRKENSKIKELAPKYYGVFNQDTFIMTVNQIAKESKLDVMAINFESQTESIEDYLLNLFPSDNADEQTKAHVHADLIKTLNLSEETLMDSIGTNSAIITYSGDYIALSTFLKNLKNAQKKLILESISIDKDGDTLTGKIILSALNIPSVDAFIDKDYSSHYFSDISIRNETDNIFEPYDYYKKSIAALESQNDYIKTQSDEQVTKKEPVVKLTSFEKSNFFFVGGTPEIIGKASKTTRSNSGQFGIEFEYQFLDLNTVNQANIAFLEQSVMCRQIGSALRLAVRSNVASTPPLNDIKSVIIDATGKQYTLVFDKPNFNGDWEYIYASLPSGITYPFMVQRIYVEGRGAEQALYDKFNIDDLNLVTGMVGKTN